MRALEASRRRLRFGAGLGLIVVLAAVGIAGLVGSHRRAERALEDRYATRTSLAAAAAGTFAAQLLGAEQQAAATSLATGTGSFGVVVSTFGFSNAVLLDAHGRVLAVYPAKPALIGRDIAGGYPHLTAAVAGRRAISPVVAAAANGEPVVGFAVPFDTPSGRRVFSGAYAVRGTPLRAYLSAMVSLPTSRFFLVDDREQVLASSNFSGPVRPLRAADPALARIYASGRAGDYGDQFFSSNAVAGTPWTVLAAISRAALLAPVNGSSQYVPWVILGGLIVTACLVWILLLRRSVDHAQLTEAYRQLDQLARQDGLTGAHTRRATGERLAEAHAAACRDRSWLSVVMADVDHFKRINDTFGHLAGDEALIAVASRLQAGLRADDFLGRWGGEEFLVVLPDTDAAAAVVVAERLRQSVVAEPITLGTGGDAITVSISAGVTSSIDAIPEVLVHVADRAMYAAKADGRDRVRSLTSPSG